MRGRLISREAGSIYKSEGNMTMKLTMIMAAGALALLSGAAQAAPTLHSPQVGALAGQTEQIRYREVRRGRVVVRRQRVYRESYAPRERYIEQRGYVQERGYGDGRAYGRSYETRGYNDGRGYGDNGGYSVERRGGESYGRSGVSIGVGIDRD